MNDQNQPERDDVEDVGAAVREGRPVRQARAYRIEVSNESLDCRAITLTDPVPLGRQILAAAGGEPVDAYSLFAILPSGDFEDIRLDEPFDLRQRGAERFVMFQTDREFKLTLDNDQLQWGKPVISGAALYKLAKAKESDAIFLEVRGGGEDRLIERTELIDLTKPGIERFYTERGLTVHVVNEDNGDEIDLPATRRVRIERLIGLIYDKFKVQRQGDDRLRCEQGGEDVLQFARLTLGEYLEAGHCKCLVWLFASGTGGASCR
jgi:hypothetical protein